MLEDGAVVCGISPTLEKTDPSTITSEKETCQREFCYQVISAERAITRTTEGCSTIKKDDM